VIYCTYCTPSFMASLYKRPASPVWWVQFSDGNGKRKNNYNKQRVGSERETADARLMLAQIEHAEHTRNPLADIVKKWEWVPTFIKERRLDPKSEDRYLKCWQWISLFLAHHDLKAPDALKFEHAQGYMEWRTHLKKKSGKMPGRSTALFELKMFSMIMSHAVRLGLTPSNPLARMGIRKDPPKEKPEITPEEFRIILAALDMRTDEADRWMKISFLISMHTGCRMRETSIPLNCIDFERNTITFAKPKGGRKRAFTAPLPDQIRPLLWDLRNEVVTCVLPFQPSRKWQAFFRDLGMSHLCFHCLRVTYITSLARRGVPLSVAMRLVNHASTLIHRVYQRLSVEDVRQWGTGLSLPEAVAIPHSPPEKCTPSRKETPAGIAKSKPTRKKLPTRATSV